MATRQEDLYAEDFYAWTQDQAAALRRLAQVRWNGPLDLEHLADEVEDLGRSDRNAARSPLQRMIKCCRKLKYASATELRAGSTQPCREGFHYQAYSDNLDRFASPPERHLTWRTYR